MSEIVQDVRKGVKARSIVIISVAAITLASGLLLSVFWLQTFQFDQKSTLTSLTSNVLASAGEYRRARSFAKDRAKQHFIAAARQRLDKLKTLAREHPDQALRAAIPIETIKKDIPSELRPYVEEWINIHGSYGRIHEDNFVRNRSKNRSLFIDDNGKSYTLYSSGITPHQRVGSNPLTGSVSGIRLNSTIVSAASSVVIDQPTNSPAREESSVSGVFGPQTTLVVRVNFSDHTPSNPTIPELQNAIFNRTGTTELTGSVKKFYQENSYNLMSVVGSVIGPYTINILRSTGCDYDTVWKTTIAHIDPDVDFTQIKHLVVIAPFTGCEFGGIASIGSKNTFTGDGIVAISTSMVSNANVRVLSHEYGHQLGMMHANFLDCGSVSVGSDEFSSNCSHDEYDDYSDVMGRTLTHLNAAHKDYMGWFSANNLITMTPEANLGARCTQEGLSNHTLTARCELEPIETCQPGSPCDSDDPQPTGLKALRIPRSNGNALFIEYRQPIGFDAALTSVGSPEQQNDFTAGAQIHATNNPVSGATYDENGQMTSGTYAMFNLTEFVDASATPSAPANKYTPSLLPGNSFTDPITGATVTVLSATPTALVVRVTTGKHDFSIPGVGISSIPDSLYPDEAVDITAHVIDASPISRVDFFLNQTATPFATDVTAPYTAHINTSLYPEGERIVVTAKAYDTAGDPWGLPNYHSSAAKQFTIDHPPYSNSTITVLRGSTPVSGAEVTAYSNTTPPTQIGRLVQTDTNGRAAFYIPVGTSFKYIVQAPSGSIGSCQSNETPYAAAPYNTTVIIPTASSSVTFRDANGSEIRGLNTDAIEYQTNRTICSSVKTGDPLYIQPGLKVRFRIRNGTSFYNTPYYTAPTQARFCLPSGACPSDIGSGGCFIAGSLIDTPTGPVPIEELQPGDRVYAYDEKQQKRVVTYVIRLLNHPSEQFGRVTLVDGTVIDVTKGHYFFDPSEKLWKAIGDFRVGQSVLRYHRGQPIRTPLAGLTYNLKQAPVYNLSIAGYHNYFVNGVLVHNILKQTDEPGEQ